MAGGVELKLEGFKEMGQRMHDMDEDMRTKLGYRAVARVMRATKADAEGILDSHHFQGNGAMRRNIAIARIKSSSPLAMIYDVGVRHGTKKQIKQTKAEGRNTNDPWYWVLHEFGFHDRSGKEVGPRPFMTPAFRRRLTDGIEMMADTLRRGIKKFDKGTTK